MAGMVNRYRFLSTFLLLALAAWSVSYISAQDTGGSRVPVLMQVTRPAGTVVNKGFEDIIKSVTRLESQKAGFISISAAESTVFDDSEEQILSMAEEAGAQFVVDNRYTVTREAIELVISCYYVPLRELLERNEVREKIGLDVDAAIEKALARTFAVMKRRAGEIPVETLAPAAASQVFDLMKPKAEESPEELQAPIPPLRTQETPPAAGSSDTAETGTGTGREGQVPPPHPDQDGQAPTESGTASKKKKHFEIAGGFYPFIPLGTVSRYMTVGYLPYLTLGFPIDLHIGYLTPGLLGAAHIFHTQGDLDASENYLVPVGASLALSIFTRGILGFSFTAAGGPAFFIVVPDPQDEDSTPAWKLVPFVKGDMGLNLRFGDTFGLSFNVGIIAFFEQSIKILGFTPGMGIVLRF